jgi:hypothetical protein
MFKSGRGLQTICHISVGITFYKTNAVILRYCCSLFGLG